MSTNRILKRIGGKLREDTRDIVEVDLPEPLRELLRKLACMDTGEIGGNCSRENF